MREKNPIYIFHDNNWKDKYIHENYAFKRKEE